LAFDAPAFARLSTFILRIGCFIGFGGLGGFGFFGGFGLRGCLGLRTVTCLGLRKVNVVSPSSSAA